MPFALTWFDAAQYFGLTLGVGIVAYAIYAAARAGRLSFLGVGGEFLCDSCKYNDERYCSLPERPNARRCPDYKSRA